MALQLRRGTDAERRGFVFAIGELVYAVDTQDLYVGDGATPGGIQVSGIDRLTDITDVQVGSYPQIAIALVACNSSGVLTINTLSQHDLTPGQFVDVNADGNTLVNGTFEVTATPDPYEVILDGPLVTVSQTADSGFIQRKGADTPDRSIIIYNSATDTWVASELSLGQMGDTDFTGITLGQNDRLAYDTATQKWTVVDGDLDSLNDVTLTSVSVDDLLLYDGSQFVNIPHLVENVADIDVRELADQQALLYDAPSQTWRPRRTVKAKEPGIKADFFLGNEQDGRDSTISTADHPLIYPSTADARWGTKSAFFEGNGRLRWSGSLGLGTQPFTVCFWMKTGDQDYGTLRYTREIFSPKDVASDVDHAFFVGRRMIYGNYVPGDAVNQNPGAVTLSTETDNAAYYIVGSGTRVIDDNEWHHIAISRESDYVFTIYVDGVLGERRTQPRLIEFFDHGGFNIGGNYQTSTSFANDNYRGYLDDIQFYAGVALYDGLDEFVVPYWPSLGRSTYYGDSISTLGDVDTESAPPVGGSVLQWDGENWVPGVTAGGRGDPGDFDTGKIGSGFIYGIKGGGDFDTATDDLPWEEVQPTVDAGDFD